MKKILGSKMKELMDAIDSSWMLIVSFLARYVFNTCFEIIIALVWLLVSSVQKRILCERHIGSKAKYLMDAINSSWRLIASFLTKFTYKTHF